MTSSKICGREHPDTAILSGFLPEDPHVLRFDLIQPGRIEITPEEGVKDSRPTSSLLRYSDYKVVVDTEHPKEDGTEYAAACGHLGLSPAEVNCVIFTHLHPDHFGHKDLFRRATFIFHKDDRFGFYFRSDLKIVLEGSALIDLSRGAGFQPVYIGCEPDLRTLGSRLYVRHSPGHTPGSLMIFAAIGGLVHAWVGDVFLNKTYFEEWKPPGSSWDQERIYEHMRYVRDRADVVIPGHGSPFTI
jgi:glyoxylase-like metal-dependent hydrolase (beta-lactamase superfamily II)